MRQQFSIGSINFPKINNAEYLYFFTQVIRLATLANPENIGISPEFMSELQANVNKMVAISSTTYASRQTALLQRIDTQRTALLLHVLGSIRTARKIPIPHINHAARALYLSTKKYIGTQKLPQNQETQQIFSLQKDLEGTKASAHVVTLGLTPFVVELFASNDDYYEHSKERSTEVAKKSLGSCKDIRLLTNEQFHYLARMACATALVKPSPEVIHFIATLNISIKDTKTAYNQRVAQHKTAKQDEIKQESI